MGTQSKIRVGCIVLRYTLCFMTPVLKEPGSRLICRKVLETCSGCRIFRCRWGLLGKVLRGWIAAGGKAAGKLHVRLVPSCLFGNIDSFFRANLRKSHHGLAD